uniref:Uncharacterized protein n=1 Tax=uncultured bacterium Contigcl_1787 TaxID=1393662 RepID=W0FMK9_9BACT|nr:hypothetical protein [uncultured bacterium Contigcl_1787]
MEKVTFFRQGELFFPKSLDTRKTK